MQLKNRSLVHRSIVSLIAVVILSGCAGKPWKKSLEEDEYKSAASLAREMSEESIACRKGLETDIILTYTSPLGKQALAGYLQFSYPSDYKFVASSPLGQPLLIIAGNQKKYQAINTPEQMYIAGGMTSFALRNKLPIHFIKGRWYDWLTGKNLISPDQLTAIHNDGENRGIWMTFEDNSGAGNISHILVEPGSRTIIEHVLETRQKKDLATIEYDNYQSYQSCMQPQHIHISGLAYGAEIDLRLSETVLTDDQQTYKLTIPPGYLQQYRP